MLCLPIETSNSSAATMAPLSPLRALVNRRQLSPPREKLQMIVTTTGQHQQSNVAAAGGSVSPSCGAAAGLMMRLPSKKRLMVRTWLPQPTVETPTSSSSSSSSSSTANDNDQENNTNTNSNCSSPVKHRVHFSRRPGVKDDDADVVKTVYRYPKPSERYYPNLYLSNHEKAEIQFLASSFGEAFLFEEEDAVENLERAFYNCEQQQRESPQRTNANVQRLEREQLKQDSLMALQQWAETEARGLEDVVSAEFQDLRSRTIAMILEYQTYLKQTLGSTVDSDELMRAFSEKVSAKSRLFSTLMARGDAYAVRAPDQESQHGSYDV
jgi:hypothetical protein